MKVTNGMRELRTEEDMAGRKLEAFGILASTIKLLST